MDLLSFGPDGWGDELAVGAWLTIRLAAVTVVFGLAFGLLGAWAKLSRIAPIRWVGQGYTTVIRGIPELLTLFLIYYGLQFGAQAIFRALDITDMAQIWPLGHFGYAGPPEISGFLAGVIALSLVFGAYATEVFRGAILAVPTGQIEAARAIGMPPFLVFRRIMLPQVWRYALPGIGNLWMVLIKDTSLVSAIALDELTRQTQIAVGATKRPFLFFATASLIYLAITAISMIVLARAEARAARGIRRPAAS
ncbi:ABC transporter permease [Zavarzinia sp. CC-PAN008]|uniref:ABC transporter permease n=1 Tax=Zavarzinia sp. CC-PAN008 TaxID=3243332 RepID=UPI003F743739